RGHSPVRRRKGPAGHRLRRGTTLPGSAGGPAHQRGRTNRGRRGRETGPTWYGGGQGGPSGGPAGPPGGQGRGGKTTTATEQPARPAGLHEAGAGGGPLARIARGLRG